jgi:hypothetical protein
MNGQLTLYRDQYGIVLEARQWLGYAINPKVASPPAERVVAFYNKRGTCEQWIKEGKGAIKWT